MAKIVFLALFLLFNVTSALVDSEEAKNDFHSASSVMPSEKEKFSFTQRNMKHNEDFPECAGTPCNADGGCDAFECYCPTIASGCIVDECFPRYCNGDGECDDPSCHCNLVVAEVPVCRLDPDEHQF